MATHICSALGICTSWLTSHMLIHRLCAWLGTFVRGVLGYLTPDFALSQAFCRLTSTLQAAAISDQPSEQTYRSPQCTQRTHWLCKP